MVCFSVGLAGRGNQSDLCVNTDSGKRRQLSHRPFHLYAQCFLPFVVILGMLFVYLELTPRSCVRNAYGVVQSGVDEAASNLISLTI